MIPATRNFGFENSAQAFVYIAIACLAALVLTLLYALWVEYGRSWFERMIDLIVKQ